MSTEPHELVVPGLDGQDVAILLNARNFAYYCDMVTEIRMSMCPFCDPLDADKNRVIKMHGGWRMWECPAKFRAEEIARHFVIAPVRHFTHIMGMTMQDWSDLGHIASWACEDEGLGLTGGALVMRFGNPTFHAGSIRHLHCNIIRPRGDCECKVTLVKDPVKIARKKQVLAVWEKMRLFMAENAGTDENDAMGVLSEEDFAIVNTPR